MTVLGLPEPNDPQEGDIVNPVKTSSHCYRAKFRLGLLDLATLGWGVVDPAKSSQPVSYRAKFGRSASNGMQMHRDSVSKRKMAKRMHRVT